MDKKIWAHISDSFEDAQAFDKNYYLSMSEEERLETVQILRERAAKLKRGKTLEGRKRLRKIVQIIQQI